MNHHQSLIEFEPIKCNKEELTDPSLHTILDELSTLYLNRMNLTTERVEEFGVLFMNWSKSKKKTAERKKIESYGKRFLKLLQDVYGYHDRSIIAFLIYYLKTPILLLDDPMFTRAVHMIKGCSPHFIQEFSQCTPMERLEFIASLCELGIDFNTFFSSSPPILEFNLVEYCKKFRETLIQNPTDKELSQEIKSNFAYFFLDGDEKKTIERIGDYYSRVLHIDCKELASQVVHDMCEGPRDKLINARLNQMKVCEPMYMDDRYLTIADNIEESTLNRIHDLLSIQKAVFVHPDKSHYKMVKNIKKMIKKRERHHSLQRKNTFLEVECYNRLMLYQQYYKRYRKEIEKIIQQYPGTFKNKNKQMRVQDILPFIQQEVLKYTICPETYKFFQIYIDFFTNNLAYCPTRGTKEESVYTLFSEDLGLLPAKEEKIEFVSDFKQKSKRLSYSELFAECNEREINIPKIEELLDTCGLSNVNIDYLKEGKRDFFITELLQSISTKYISEDKESKEKQETDSVLFWILLRPYLNVDEEHHYYIRDATNLQKNMIKEYAHYFGTPIKNIKTLTGETCNVYCPTNQFWKEQSSGYCLDCFKTIRLGVYHPKKKQQYLNDFSESEMKQVEEYIQKNKKEHKHVEMRAKEQIVSDEWLDKCKQFLFQKCQSFYRDNDSKKNCIQDCQYFLDGIKEYLQTSTLSADFFIKKCATICVILDKYDSPYYEYAKSFQMYWLDSDEQGIKECVKWGFYQYFPECMIVKDRKEEIKRFSQLEHEYLTECYYYCEQSSVDQNLFQFELTPYTTLKDSLFYTVNDSGQVNCYTKEDMFKYIRGEMEYKGHKQLEEMCKEFLCFNEENPMSVLSYIQSMMNQYIIEHKSECIGLALDITNYIRGKMIQYQDLNEMDKHRVQPILASCSDVYLSNIALDYLVRYSIEYYRQIVLQEIEDYINNHRDIIQMCKEKGEYTLHMYSNDIELAQKDTSEWSPYIQPIIHNIETKCGIVCTEQNKNSILRHIGCLLELPQYIIQYTVANECSVCNKQEQTQIRTITIHKEKNILVDKKQQFCSIECMDIHLVSAPTPNEEEMEQLEIRSYIRDMIKKCYTSIEDCKIIGIQALQHSISSFLKEKYSIQIPLPIFSLHLIPEQEREKARMECRLFLSKFDVLTNHFQTLLKQICLYKEPSTHDYYLPYTTDISIYNKDYVLTDSLQSTHPFTTFPIILTTLKDCADYFNIKNPATVDTRNKNSTLFHTLLDNEIVKEMYVSVVDECTEKSLDKDLAEKDIETLYYMDKTISIKKISDWIRMKCHELTKLQRPIDFFADIVYPFEHSFSLSIPSRQEFMFYYRILHCIQTLKMYILFLLTTKQSHSLSSFTTWLQTYIGENTYDDAIDNCFDLLRSHSKTLSDDIKIEECFKQIEKHVASNIKYKKYKQDELCNDVLYYFKCDWSDFMKKCKDSMLLFHMLYYFCIDSILQTKEPISQPDKEEGIIISDDELDIWVTRVDNLTPTTLNKYVLPLDDTKTVLKNKITEEFEYEKSIHPKVKHVYQLLLNANNDEEIIDHLERFLPETFDEENVSSIISGLHEKKDRKELYVQLKEVLKL